MTTREPWGGGSVGEGLHCLLAPNPGPMTLDGTNTWLLAGPHGAIVIDPGPDDETHLRAVLDHCAQWGGIAQILLTHGHLDHSAGAARLRELAHGRPPVRALDPGLRLGDEGLGGGQVLDLGDRELRVVATPGHTSDCLTFVLLSGGTPLGGEIVDVLTGDTVLGRGTTVVAHPDGVLGDYLDSLRHLRQIVAGVDAGGGRTRILPGHGPLLPDAVAVVDHYLIHRQERLDQVRAAVAAGHRSADEIVALVYADSPVAVRPAARLSVLAQLAYLAAETTA